MQVVSYPLKDNQYVKENTVKKSIIFHHTAGNKSAKNVIDAWNTDDRGRVSTCYVIGYDGTVLKAFDEAYWSYALGVKQANASTLEKQAIQIELCAYGFLRKVGNDFINDYGMKMPIDEVITLPNKFKGYSYFHKYSDAQINSLKLLIPEICKRHGIVGYLTINDFALSKSALSGGGGFWTHNSFRVDKTDIYPDPRILEAFKQGWNS